MDIFERIFRGVKRAVENEMKLPREYILLQKQGVSCGGLSEIEILTDAVDVAVISGEANGSEANVSLQSRDMRDVNNVSVDISREGGLLIVKTIETGASHARVKVDLPNLFRVVDGIANVGCERITDRAVNRIDVKTRTGDVDCSGLRCSLLSVTSDDGDVSIKFAVCTKIELLTLSSDITCKTARCDEFKAISENGDIAISNSICGIRTCKSRNGDVALN